MNFLFSHHAGYEAINSFQGLEYCAQSLTGPSSPDEMEMDVNEILSSMPTPIDDQFNF